MTFRCSLALVMTVTVTAVPSSHLQVTRDITCKVAILLLNQAVRHAAFLNTQVWSLGVVVTSAGCRWRIH